MPGPSPRGLPAHLAVGLFLLTAITFAPTVLNGFVGIDDGTTLLHNADVLGGLSARGLRFAFHTTLLGNWMPLAWLSHELDVTLFGTWAPGHHAMSVLLHAGSVVLFFFAWFRATSAPWSSALAAGLYGLHPARVESVAWAAERKDVLCALCCAGAVLLYVEYRRAPTVLRYLAVSVLFVLALLAKPMAVTLPAALLLLDAWPLGWGVRPLWRVLEKLPWLLLALPFCLLAVTAQREHQALVDAATAPLASRVFAVPRAYLQDLVITAWPLRLSFQYQRPVSSVASSLAAVGILLILGVGAQLWRRERPSLAVGFYWFLGMALPTAGLVAVGAQLTADRYTYLPHAGLFLGLAFALPESVLFATRLRGLLAGGILLVYAALSAAQCTVWRDTGELLEHALSVEPDNAWNWGNLGAYQLETHQLADAEHSLRRALELSPGSPYITAVLAQVELDQGHLDAALALSHQAETLGPGEVWALLIRARVLRATHDLAGAERSFAAAQAASPLDPEAAREHANCLGELGRLPAAEEVTRLALLRFPHDPQLLFTRAITLARMGEARGARQALLELLSVDPTFPGATQTLKNVDEDLAKQASPAR